MEYYYFKSYKEASKKGAGIIASQVILKPNSILGLATGSTPIGTYKELIELYKNKTLNFENCKSFNLDEYVGLNHEHDQSYYYFMHDNLFNHINMKEENINVPDGMAKDVDKFCKEYDEKIDREGGVDIQLLGIGSDGHIGFNEPATSFSIGTHKETLKDITRKDNARFFKSLDEVPTHAITMGLLTIMKAKKILIMACGQGKKDIFEKALHGPVVPEVPASILQFHPHVYAIFSEEGCN